MQVNWKAKIARFFALREIRKQATRLLERALGRPLSRKEKAMLGKLFGASFKTTIFGWLATAVGGTAVGWTDPVTGKPNYLMIVGAIFAAIWARVQKDHDVSGVPQ